MHWPSVLVLAAALSGSAAASAGAVVDHAPTPEGQAASASAIQRADFGAFAMPHGRTVRQGSASVSTQAPTRSWAWPLDPPHPVLADFHPPAQRWGSGHRGVDLGGPLGAPIRAPTDGVVSFSGSVAGRPVLVIAHAGGLRSTFEPVIGSVAVGQAVRRSDVVGVLAPGPWHCSPVSCLHWGVLRGDTYLDPLGLLAGRVVLLPLS